MEVNKHTYASAATALLQKLIATPSFSKEEDATASILFDYLNHNGVTPNRHLNNVWAANKNNVKLMQTISTKVTEFPKLKKIIEKYPHIYASIGIQPHEVDAPPNITT